jgi:hypothetical protein
MEQIAQADKANLDVEMATQLELLETKKADLAAKEAEISTKNGELQSMNKTQEQKIVDIEFTESELGKYYLLNSSQAGNGYVMPGQTGFFCYDTATNVQTKIANTCKVHTVLPNSLAARKGMASGELIVGFAIGKTTDRWGGGFSSEQRHEVNQFVPGPKGAQEEFLEELMKAEGYTQGSDKQWEKLETVVDADAEVGTTKVLDSTEYLFFPISDKTATIQKDLPALVESSTATPAQIAVAKQLMEMNTHLKSKSSTAWMITNGNKSIWSKVTVCMKAPLIVRVCKAVDSEETQKLRGVISNLENERKTIQDEIYLTVQKTQTFYPYRTYHDISGIEYQISGHRGVEYPAIYERYDDYLGKWLNPQNLAARVRDAEIELEAAKSNNSKEVMDPYTKLSGFLGESYQPAVWNTATQRFDSSRVTDGGREAKLNASVTFGDGSKQDEMTRASALKGLVASNFGVAAFTVQKDGTWQNYWSKDLSGEFFYGEEQMFPGGHNSPNSYYEKNYYGHPTGMRLYRSSVALVTSAGGTFEKASIGWRKQEQALNKNEIDDNDLDCEIAALGGKVDKERARKLAISKARLQLSTLRKQHDMMKSAGGRLHGESAKSDLSAKIATCEEEMEKERKLLGDDRRTYLAGVEKPRSFSILSPDGSYGRQLVEYMAQQQATMPSTYQKITMDLLLSNVTENPLNLASKIRACSKIAHDIKTLNDDKRKLNNELGDMRVEYAAVDKAFQYAKGELDKAEAEKQSYELKVSRLINSEDVQKERVDGIEQELSLVDSAISDVKDNLKVLDPRCTTDLPSLRFLQNLLVCCSEQADVRQTMRMHLQVY